MKPSVAIVCDWLIARGGAERVIAALCDMFPEAPIYTSIYNKALFPEFAQRRVITSFIQKMPRAFTSHYLYLPLMPYVFEQFDLSAYNIVISSSHSCAKGVITKPRTLHICYCHSPMRYAWDNCHNYFERYGIPRALRYSAKRILHEMRMWDRLSAERVDVFAVNSKHVQERVQKYYRKNSTVIYPPVDTEKFKIGKNDGRYFLAVGRLTSYKRFDLLVDTFNDIKLPLVIVGTGRDEKMLKKRAGRFITFLGAISDIQLSEVYQNAHALVFPQTEDFGITPLEAMSCGTPVIAYAEGGALETVNVGHTGLLFYEQTIESLKKAILEFGAMKWDKKDIRAHAETFGKKVFENSMDHLIESSWRNLEKNMKNQDIDSKTTLAI